MGAGSASQQDEDQRAGEGELADPEGDPEVGGARQLGNRSGDGEGRNRNPYVARQCDISRVATMLTDYHVHLRQDEPGTTAERYFTVANADAYKQAAAARGIDELGVSEHIHRFRDALDVWQHPYWVESAHDDLDAYCEFLARNDLRVGIEADYIVGAEDRIANLLEARPFDYVIGSVHFIGEGSVDQQRWDVWEIEGHDPDKVWRKYFERLAAAAESGLYDILAHPDLVKVWGSGRATPEGDLRRYYEPAVEAMAASGVAVEVSTAGYRKQVGEIYPARPFAEMCIEAGLEFTISSDAHLPEHLGWNYEQAVAFMREVGIERICAFEDRERRTEPLEDPLPAGDGEGPGR